ncbi:MAG: galactokinase [Salinivirgaceae bacterium]|nr:galactokinase [Salinivirgaceae bacterium]
MNQKIRDKFIALFGAEPQMFRAPGRVNLIGEHTDYNEGFVLPAAVDKMIAFAVKPNSVGRFRFFAFDLNESFETEADNIGVSQTAWANYLLGVVAQFRKAGLTVPAFDCVFGGNVPLGAGMSSSAAIEVGMAFAINSMFGLGVNRLTMTKFAQMAEHEYAGVNCGIMDQFASMHGKAGHVVRLDCRSLDFEYFPLDMTNYRLVLVNTGVKHSLASSEYNKRRAECEEGVGILQKYYNGVRSLRDATEEMIEAHRAEFGDVVYRRCSYIVEENERLLAGCKALANGDFAAFGQLMFGSHEGLSHKYEVSCAELDQLVAIARTVPGVLGSRMMGGGFGGCTITLVEKTKVADFEAAVKRNYKTPDGREPVVYEVVIADGAGELKIEN